MKNYLKNAVLAVLLLPCAAFAEADSTAWEAEVRQFDTAYWNAFNSCDVPKLAQMNTEDLEFYHDRGGPMKGRAAFADAVSKNICGRRPDAGVRREAVEGSMKFYPMRAGGKLYGAIVSGEHRFYEVNKGAEVLSGQARFTHMLLLKDGAWKVARVLSFDHGRPPPAAAKTR